jgi:phosphohistidine phosphatase SixA
MRKYGKLAGILIFASLIFVARAQAQQSRTIYLIRHADKVSDDTDAPLSAAGQIRAQCLAKTLADAQIRQIFTSNLQRTQQTAAPLAQQLHLEPVAIPISKPEEVVKAVRASKAASVLVVWHDQTLPGILRGLGAPEIRPIGHFEYDRFFVVTLAADGKESETGFGSIRYCISSQ